MVCTARVGSDFGSPEFRTSSDHTKIEDLPVRMWSSYSLSAESSRERKDQPPLFESKLVESDAGRLQGEIRHNLSGPLHNWVVLYKNFLYHPVLARGELTIGEWKPGQMWRPHFDGQSTLVRVYLQGHRQTLTKGQGKEAKMDQVRLDVTPYDPNEFDPTRLLTMVSFTRPPAGPRIRADQRAAGQAGSVAHLGFQGLPRHRLRRRDGPARNAGNGVRH